MPAFADSPPASAASPLVADAGAVLGLSAAELAVAYRDRRLSPVEVTRAALAHCETVQAGLNAFTLIDHEGALAAAEASEARWQARAPASPIDGVPGTIKDIVWVRGRAVRYGSRAADPVVATDDAPVVARLRAAGMVTLGLTTTPEFGWKALTDSPGFGITRNPLNPALTPGGSSGGAAVAAATGCGVLHLGTDGGGSIRVPAAFTGLCGHKPSYGLVPAFPLSAFGTVAHIGPIARGLADCEAMLAIMAGSSPEDWTQPAGQTGFSAEAPVGLAGARVGLWREPPCGATDAAIASIFEDHARTLGRLGAILEPIALPGANLLDLFHVFWFSGAANRLRGVVPEKRALCDPGFLDIAEAGARFSAADYMAASTRRAEFGAAMERLFERVDIILSPATSVLPFEAGHEVPPGSGMARWTEWAGFSFPINLSQQPASVIPAGHSPDGRPVGLQVIARRGQDARALAFATAISKALLQA